MPIYEYACKSCEQIKEVMQGINDEQLKECEDCGGEMERIMSQSAFHLKGSGWYKTDYASKKNKPTEKKEKKPECAGCPSASPSCG